MSVSYTRLMYLLIDRNITNAQLMREANISANIIAKIKNGRYISLEKIENICVALDCTPNDILEFVTGEENNNG
ncbi:helix-turn-helix transcriptional regulator [Listeria seeligeri]|uniref:helix-turn-helix domain-containing protein n=1 Tax=Listeria seeligeri TaxID=1640 RepID=UPI00095276AC|nr:helix-turn-helix transcriptional regulator [Listeria seeligeri]MBF2374482.1 helix-turn-helix transcriptional regulator [Listeria seeligeri]OLQ23662.1 hypothetical protein AJQ09_06375 [Listeria seeligeri]